MTAKGDASKFLLTCNSAVHARKVQTAALAQQHLIKEIPSGINHSQSQHGKLPAAAGKGQSKNSVPQTKFL